MKRKIVFLLTVAALSLSAFALSGSNTQTKDDVCPLRGTPSCPEYPQCCK